MFARVTITHMRKDKMQDAVRLYKESVVASAKTQKGFRAIYLLSDFETGKGLSISFWDSKEDALANEKSGYYQEQVGKFKELFTAPPSQEGYEVTAEG